MLRWFLIFCLFIPVAFSENNSVEYPIPANSVGKVVRGDGPSDFYIVIKNVQNNTFLVHKIEAASKDLSDKLEGLEGKFVYTDGVVRMPNNPDGKVSEVFVPFRLQEISLSTVDAGTMKEIQKQFDLSPQKVSTGFGLNDKVATGVTGGIGLALIWSLGPIGILPATFFGYLIWRNANSK